MGEPEHSLRDTEGQRQRLAYRRSPEPRTLGLALPSPAGGTLQLRGLGYTWPAEQEMDSVFFPSPTYFGQEKV